MFIPSTRAVVAGAGSLIFVLLVSFSWNSTKFTTLNLSNGGKTGHEIVQDALNQTLGFQKTFSSVLNLPSRTDHRDSMSLASAFFGLQIEYIDGVTEVDENTMPPRPENFKLEKGAYNSWRAHMNAMRLIVEQNFTSALILEDDVDWDLRIKTQMRDFGKASQLLLQVGQEDREYDSSEAPDVMPRTSPYGELDRWDLLWLGHCGSQIPTAADDDGHPTIPQGRAIIRDDRTVPETQHLRFEYGGDSLKKEYGNHTPVISHARRNVCTLAYAVTQQGARRFLHELALSKMTSSTDLMFQQVCDGLGGRKRHTCLSVQPPLFEHHRPVSSKASFSDIVEHGNGYNKEAYTYNIR